MHGAGQPKEAASPVTSPGTSEILLTSSQPETRPETEFTADAPLISFRGVGKVYPNGTQALRAVNLSIPRQDFAFLVGPSGAGKSTLVRLLIREEKATVGKIYIDGQELGRLKHRNLPKLRRKIGIVFQDYKLLPKLTVFENVEFALRVTRGVDRLTKAKVEEVLSIVGLEGTEKKFPDELSGGQQQRVAIARALSHDPKIFVADEPTGNLDPATSWEILQLLMKINNRGATVVMATHNKEIVDVMQRRVIVINNGTVIRDDASGGYHAEDGTPADAN
ncbi:MAG: cell division transport system ATP-binding protein [Chloroflexota bacterium]|nr:cell division transport system ATP-binding protein [Chloroflexota bacterium]